MNSVFHTLAEPNRFHIIELLRKGPRSVTEIAELLRLRQPQTSKHLHALSRAGLVKVEPVAQQRIYSLQAQPFRELEVWLSSFGHLWEERLDALDVHLQHVQKERGRK